MFNFFNNFSQNGQEVNELRTERIARNANPLTLVATAQANQDPYYQTSKPHKSYAPSSKPSIPTRTHTTTRHKGKEIAKPITPQSKTASEEDNDPEQAQRDKDMQKNLVLIAKYFKKIYKPTNNNLRTSTNSKNKNVDTTPRVKDSAYHKEKILLCKQAEQYDWLADTDEEIDEQELEAHYSYMEKIQEVPTADSGIDFEPLEQVQNNAGYNVFANDIQHYEQSESINQNEVESDDERVALANLKLDVDENKKIQKQLKKANTTLAQELKECKTILAETSKTLGESISVGDSCLVTLQTKQTEFEKYKAFNNRTIDYEKFERKLNETLGQLALKDIKIKEGLKTKAYEISVVKEKHDELIKQSLLTKSHYEGLVKQKNKDALAELQCLYLHKVKECDCLEQKLSKKTESVSKEVHTELLQRFAKVEKHLISLEIALQKCKEQKLIEKGKGKYVDTKFDKPSVVRQPNAQRIPKPSVLEVNHKTNVSIPQDKSNQLKDKVMPNNSRVKLKKTQVEVYPRIPSVSNKIKSVTACKDSLNSRTLNANAICATFNICLVDSNHFACVTKMLSDVNARTKKPNVVPISTRKPKGHANKSVATPFKKKVASKSTNQKPQSYYRMLYEKTIGSRKCHDNRVYYVEGLNYNLFSIGQFCDADLEVAFRKSTCFVRDLRGNDLLTGNRGSDLYAISLQESTSSTPLCLMAKASQTQAWLWHRRLSHLNFDYINLLLKKDVVIGLPKLKYIKDQLCSSCELSKAKRSSFKSKVVLSSKGRLNLLHMNLCGLMWVASINGKKYILNGVVERQNHTLFKATRTMLLASQLPLFFWDEAIATTCYTQNRSIIIMTHDKTAYHIINDMKPSIKHLHIFGCICYITRDGENLDKIKEKGDLCILVGYSTQSKGYCVYNKRTRMIVESIHILFDEIKEVSETSVANDTSDLVPQRQKASDYDNSDPFPQLHNVSSSADAHVQSQQELDLLFGPLYDEFFNAGSNPQDKQSTTNIQPTSAPSTPTYVHAKENNDDQAEEDHLPNDEFTNHFCTSAYAVAESSSHNIGNSNVPTFNQPQEELHQFDRLQAWELVDKPFGKTVIRLKWLWKNKKDEDQTVIHNKARLVAKGKALYGLKQAPRVWYDELLKFLTSEGFTKGTIDSTLFTIRYREDILLVQIYIDDIIFGSTNPKYTKRFEKLMHSRFEMSLMGEMKFFLRLQIHQSPRGIFINQAKYDLEILHKHGMEKGQSTGTPMATKPKLDADLSGNQLDQTDYRSKIGSLMYLTSSRPDIVQAGSSFGLTAFLNADHVGCIDSRKSTSEGIQFIGDKLVSWMSKKQNCTAMSLAEAKYVVLSASCAQVMWMRTQLQDYGFNYNKIPLYCDSQSAIAISCNPVHHSRTKHIHTLYHFIKEQVKNGIIELYFVRTEYQLADMFTKALPEDRFMYLVRRIGMRYLTPAELEVLAKESA
uniref:Retrotransposon protein, putative, unclassified n=1 Tax=Tanacetum cinerariifolium TaxID=118510 RepID=A0A6L2LJ41_TANCI|nr:retrotransposon protein, putative, unclassified [Tanacetum cinerariifolium]